MYKLQYLFLRIFMFTHFGNTNDSRIRVDVAINYFEKSTPLMDFILYRE